MSDTTAAAPETTLPETDAAPTAPAAGVGTTLLAWLDRFAPALAFAAALAVWEAATWVFAIPSFLLPAPSAIVAAGLATPAEVWLGHIWATLRVALMGYLLAIAVSVPLAVALASSRLLSRTLYPMLVVVQSTPIVAVAPIIVVTLGASDLPRVVITFLITFFPIVVSTVTGLLSTPEELIELSRSLRAGRSREILHIRLPYAVPHLVSALKISTTLAVIGAVVAEFVAAERGLGFFILFSTSFFKIPAAFAGLVVLVAISLALFRLVGLAQKMLVPWSLPKSER
ncbi:ABC transporter permease [Rhodoplanes sp. TEM]|uniref:ABC transporter permease n=1 Tax=Rhodoplanes tepidamans TaxID=200616 RepID=A0ABT5JJQ3_RHOTP|nr:MULTISPECIES: ABC transporter permease [Rhodoplanes]MDC7789961.1 ABC transporter permease [Rhodoplanes tepidamans]MDC7985764.1 ABC transporter permease [Rhodoplanes sp. TEM]MDQ0357279.1 NitT/TauT family transport system permease protein [Rhodoplanes tepidamans]